ncbi:unnamed protein product [Miscanthus lutarioriparius]|uniref:Myb/SANT-like domain-containing protein n=1 Tax=Miscanthus lutarioriparius TaxID=422564 RepID=A0A811PNQ9_9POAL|nr:unnamed protein product [Miscanthus lutarioriparius]
MRWNNNTSGFVLRRMAQLVSDGSRPNKVFKDKVVNYVAKALKEYSGEDLSPTQVYNHLRKWRQKWSRVCKLKYLSGALFDTDTNAIMLEGEHYLSHCKDHPKDADFLNTPIRFYSEMEAIFGHAMATSKFVVGSGEALWVNQAESMAAMAEGSASNHVCEEKTNTEVDDVNNVANALRETRPAHVDANLYLVIMEMYGFS